MVCVLANVFSDMPESNSRQCDNERIEAGDYLHYKTDHRRKCNHEESPLSSPELDPSLWLWKPFETQELGSRFTTWTILGG